MKYLKMFVTMVAVLMVATLIQPSHQDAIATLYNGTIAIVDGSGNILGGVSSGTTASYNQVVRVVDGSGNVLNKLASNGVQTTVLTAGASTYTTPTGASQLDVILVGGGGGGGGATSGGAAAEGAGTGGSGSFIEFVITGSLASTYTVSPGAVGTAGTCSATPVAAGNGGNTTWTMNYPAWTASTVEAVGNYIIDSNNHVQVVTAVSSDAMTGGSAPAWATTVGNSTTDNHVTWVEFIAAAVTVTAPGGGGGGTALVAGVGGAGGAGGSVTGTTPTGAGIIGQSGGSAGVAGNASATPVAATTNKQSFGGNPATVNGSGNCVAVATPGQTGYIIVRAYGAIGSL